MTALHMLGANPSMRRAWLAHNTGHALDAVADTAFTPEQVRSNIENLIGATHVPLGIAGPIRVNGDHAQGSYYVPFATTEGTLVSTYQYGMRAITEAGGANAHVLADSLDITPCFVLTSALEAITLGRWLHEHLPELKQVAAQTTTHGHLVDLHTHVFGRRLFPRFVFTTGDAMGMNMVNIAVDRICRHAAELTGCQRYYLRCNYSSDKKPAGINLFRPYGKEVAIDFTLPAAVAETHLGVSPREMVDFAAAGRYGALQAGALGMNAHFRKRPRRDLHRLRPGRRAGRQRQHRVHRRRARRRRRPLRVRAAPQPRRRHRRGRDRPADAERLPRAARLPRRRHRTEVRGDRRGNARRRRHRDLRRSCQRAVHRSPQGEPRTQPPADRAALTGIAHLVQATGR